MPQKTKAKHHKKPKSFGGFTYFAYLCTEIKTLTIWDI